MNSNVCFHLRNNDMKCKSTQNQTKALQTSWWYWTFFLPLEVKYWRQRRDLLLPNYQNFDLWICKCVPCGLVARIRRSHRRGRGSIPRTGDSNFASPVQCPGRLCLQDWKCSKRLMHCKMKMQGILLIIWLIDDFFHRKTFPKKILPKTKTELDLIGLLV